ncbi:exonuclease SbcC [Marmoricola sp. OAE513]|uniref:AAA family ATPase n=1 Tax=Marmoricola sp. OAE513 TaxID=2817894 RepID=UPI001AE3E39C
MRLHHLSVTAFGPFAGTVEVDFDELSSAGLFLLTGATGAGKTSVLDAVCFALYGQVPGDRAGAKHLRSDHAAPQVAPEVRLRLSIGERELLFTRSPAWMRPKLRGTGETKVQAHVLVEELRDGSWTVLTNRLDDAGLLVSDLLGMTCAQFNQVALLPQGRFQAFLRATSAERHAVLQQLFRTDRYERIEHWLVERRTRARRASEAAGESVLETVNRLREASGSEVEEEWFADLGTAFENGDLERWVAAGTAAATGQKATSAARSQVADADLLRATTRLEEAQRLRELRARGARAEAAVAEWAARADELEELRSRTLDHHRAAPLTALARSHDAAERAASAARTTWSAWTLPAESLDDALGRARAAHATAVAFTPRETARLEARARADEVRSTLRAVESGVAELELVIADQPAVIAEAAAATDEARAAAARHPLALARVDALETSLGEARRAELLGLELTAARTDVLSATSTAQRAREHYLDLREARINNMAGELAGQLASGCSCPVCGSASHPAPARSQSNGVGRAEEDQARKELEDAEFELQARQVQVASLEGELSGLELRLAGLDRERLADQLASARDEAERLEPLAAALDVLTAHEATCRDRLERARADLASALLERTALQTELAGIAELDEAIATEWESVLAASGSADAETSTMPLAEIIGLRARRVSDLERAATDLQRAQESQHQADQLFEQLGRAAADAGFEDPAAAVASLLAPEDLRQAEDLLAEADLAVHAARATLADPDVLDALEQLPLALPDLEAAVESAAAVARAAASAYSAATARCERLTALASQLGTRLEAWAPLRADHRTVAALAALVEGKSVDNPQRMRLAAYVLAERLRQVVDAANERLAAMSDQRYALEHTDDRGYGEQRGGLSLRVRDDWNGVHRDPATLSGGETFVVSLALALGLADTVAHEAGGTDIDTLFIDEGFGSLDADTLEDVMDTLDRLRDGGRVVGLVSHVPELRSRIATQLEVSKGRSGSTLRAVLSGG